MSGARSVRRARAVESFKSAADAIGTLEPGLAVFIVLRGQWNMTDAITAVLDQTGPAAVSVWTWTLLGQIDEMIRVRTDSRIIAGTLVMDATAGTGGSRAGAQASSMWMERFGAGTVRQCKTHAKIATVEGGGFRVLIRGSVNLADNKRFDQLDITEGGPDFDLVRRLEASMPVVEFAPGPPNEWAGLKPMTVRTWLA